MGRLQSIENSLSAINGAIFQELCDSFLAIRNSNYSAFSRTGSQKGKQKTRIGTPDTFILLPNGKYIFVEYSTNVSKGLSKLKGDINKCLNQDKTGIPLDQIAEIILCINFNLKTDEVEALRVLLKDTRIAFSLYTLDFLSLELLLNHRDLAHEYLGVELNSGQVISIDRFIQEYDRASQRIATSLDNRFIHRENELAQIIAELSNNDFIILTGQAGVGKTKLGLEAIKLFLENNLTYKAYCISYKNHSLLQDLNQQLAPDKDYILFVDDANRIDAFSQITGFYKSIRHGSLKIIITVRDYAYQEIGMLCQEYSPIRIDVNKFSDEQITNIISTKPFEILDSSFQRKINQIAQGNPRLAIMTALLAKAEQNIESLSDVSELFERYFSTFVKDKGQFAKSINIKCLGLIGFFHAIPYKNKTILVPILNNFELSYTAFIEVVDNLEQLELVEIQFEYVKIPEQNLATYFFYRAFIKEDLLSFETLLYNYFSSDQRRFTDTIIPANNTFGGKRVMDVLKPKLQDYWVTIKELEDEAFDYLKTFWFYLIDETKIFLYQLIDEIPERDSQDYSTSYEQNEFSYNREKVLSLLGEFFRAIQDIKEPLELGLKYVEKKAEHLPEFIYTIKETLYFDIDDARYDFFKQRVLFEILIKGTIRNNIVHEKAFLGLSGSFLSHKFQHFKGDGGKTVSIYQYPIPCNSTIQELRKNIWINLSEIFGKYPTEVLKVLNKYMENALGIVDEILAFDTPYILEIIEAKLSTSDFDHCVYVQDQIRWFKRQNIEHPSFNGLIQKFRNYKYEVFLKIDWDRFRDKEMYEFSNFNEYDKLKEEEIRNSFVFQSIAEADEFYNTFVILKNSSKNNWNYNKSLDLIIDENYTHNSEIGLKMLSIIIEKNNDVGYIPFIPFRNNLSSNKLSNQIWKVIQKKQFQLRFQWEIVYYEYLDEKFITDSTVEDILKSINRIKEPNITIHFDRLSKYLKIDSKLFQKILSVMYSKNQKEEIRLRVWMDFFSAHFEHLGSDFDLIGRFYLQQEKLQNHFDFEGKGFLRILKETPNFLSNYIESIYSDAKYGLSGDHRNFGFVWSIADIENTLEEAFNLIVDKERLFMGISSHFCNSFFQGMAAVNNERAEGFLMRYAQKNNNNSKRMNAVVDITRHSMKQLFEIVLLQHIENNQDVKVFSKIWWRGNGGTVMSGDVIFGDIEASEWSNILSIVSKSDLGIELIEIKTYLNKQIESSLKSGDWERQRRFIERR